MMECDRAWVRIDLDALAHNIRQLKGLLLPHTELWAVVKANGYGHGAVAVARTALEQGATGLAVATVLEGIELRQAGLQAPILLLGATHTRLEIEAIVQWQLEPTLCTPEQALFCSQQLQQSLRVHLNIDTGMSRLGPRWPQGPAFVQWVSELPYLKIASLYSHLATADAIDPSFMETQNHRFQEVIQRVQAQGIPLPQLHLANSAGLLRGPQFHYDLVRVGLALYGLYPAPMFEDIIQLRPVMQVQARVTQVKTVPAGTGISYGHTFVAPKPLQIAVLGIGYADGVPRPLSNRMQVLIRDQLVPQIGAITMDQLMVDVTAVPEVQVGDVATLIGGKGKTRLTVEAWAEQLGTISYEIVCGFQPRLPRVT
jgi:alanine racemase